MVEGDLVFKEAIQFLKSLSPLPPLIWDQNLAQSALEHVSDIGPKGLLLYQSSDGTEPEDRIAKYGNYTEPLGENIDFGPNDAMGVIVSLTLDDGEEQRPHRENLFKDDFKKVGIACGPHETEFQMCVMDFAFDFRGVNEPVSVNNNVRQDDRMNRENVIKGLETIKQFFGYGLPSTAEMFDSYYGILNDAIAMLKEQDSEIVRCRDCRFFDIYAGCGKYLIHSGTDRFCADGRRRDES